MLHNIDFLTVISADRRRDAHEAARRGELVKAARRRPAAPDRAPASDVVIRLSRADDTAALERLAILSERPLARGSFVVAEQWGTLVAALPLDVPGDVLRDPFRPAHGLVDLLKLRARQVRDAERRPSRFRLRGLARV